MKGVCVKQAGWDRSGPFQLHCSFESVPKGIREPLLKTEIDVDSWGEVIEPCEQ